MSERPNYESSMWKVDDADLEWQDKPAERAPAHKARQPEAKRKDAPSDGSKKETLHTNLREPELVDGQRQVAMNRVVGMDRPFYTKPEDGVVLDSKKALEHLREKLYGSKEDFKTLLEKTPEQKEIIKFVIDQLPVFLKEYGLEKPVRIPEEAIQIFDMSGWSKEGREKQSKTTASWVPKEQIIRINGDIAPTLDHIQFAETVAHELIHAHAFQSLEIGEVKGEDGKMRRPLNYRRNGLINFIMEKDKDGKEVPVDYFAEADEGVTETLARRFTRKNMELIPHSAAAKASTMRRLQEMHAAKKRENPAAKIRVVDALTRLEYGDDKDKATMTTTYQGAYEKEVRSLRKEVEYIFARAEEYQKEQAAHPKTRERESLHEILMGFKDSKDVLKFITGTYFSGRQLPLARVLKKFHEDRTFRQIGESTNLRKKRDPERFE